MVDPDLLLRKLADLDTYLIQLGLYAGLTEGDLSWSTTTQSSTPPSSSVP